jgi:F-type H+-transporting ATPase subunit epsilon
MANDPFTLDIVTLKQVVFSEPITSVSAPGSEGYFGIHTGHTPFVSSLQAGIIRIGKTDGTSQALATSGGFLMTDGKKVILLADTAEQPEEIDVARAQAARERAEKRLAERSADTDMDRAKASLLRAVTRLKVAGK